MAADKKENAAKGLDGEELAAAYLSERGYMIMHMRWKSGKNEIDIIAQKEKHLVFVEVKTRYSSAYAEPWEAVNSVKRRKICTGANTFIKSSGTELEPRFDIISIIKSNGKCSILHIEDAFRPWAV